LEQPEEQPLQVANSQSVSPPKRRGGHPEEQPLQVAGVVSLAPSKRQGEQTEEQQSQVAVSASASPAKQPVEQKNQAQASFMGSTVAVADVPLDLPVPPSTEAGATTAGSSSGSSASSTSNKSNCITRIEVSASADVIIAEEAHATIVAVAPCVPAVPATKLSLPLVRRAKSVSAFLAGSSSVAAEAAASAPPPPATAPAVTPAPVPTPARAPMPVVMLAAQPASAPAATPAVAPASAPAAAPTVVPLARAMLTNTESSPAAKKARRAIDQPSCHRMGRRVSMGGGAIGDESCSLSTASTRVGGSSVGGSPVGGDSVGSSGDCVGLPAEVEMAPGASQGVSAGSQELGRESSQPEVAREARPKRVLMPQVSHESDSGRSSCNSDGRPRARRLTPLPMRRHFEVHQSDSEVSVVIHDSDSDILSQGSQASSTDAAAAVATSAMSAPLLPLIGPAAGSAAGAPASEAQRPLTRSAAAAVIAAAVPPPAAMAPLAGQPPRLLQRRKSTQAIASGPSLPQQVGGLAALPKLPSAQGQHGQQRGRTTSKAKATAGKARKRRMGCSRCRWAALGCIGCNSVKKRRHAARTRPEEEDIRHADSSSSVQAPQKEGDATLPNPSASGRKRPNPIAAFRSTRRQALPKSQSSMTTRSMSKVVVHKVFGLPSEQGEEEVEEQEPYAQLGQAGRPASLDVSGQLRNVFSGSHDDTSILLQEEDLVELSVPARSKRKRLPSSDDGDAFEQWAASGPIGAGTSRPRSQHPAMLPRQGQLLQTHVPQQSRLRSGLHQLQRLPAPKHPKCSVKAAVTPTAGKYAGRLRSHRKR